jgi:proteasome beta subunit
MDMSMMERPDIKKTGTTTLGMICKDGVVVAADKKATMGYLIANKESDKIQPLADHIAMTVAGAWGDAQTLVRYLKAEFKLFELQNGRKISVKGAASLTSNILQNNKFYPYFVQLIIAGYDEDGAQIFTLDALGASEPEKRFFSTGSGSPMALGVLEDGYRDNMSVEEGSRLGFRAVKAAIERDIASGGNAIDVGVITKDGIKIVRHDLRQPASSK